MTYHFDEDVQKLKTSVQAHIQREVIAFTAATGVTPSRIEIRMIESTTHQSKVKTFVVGGIEISFEL